MVDELDGILWLLIYRDIEVGAPALTILNAVLQDQVLYRGVNADQCRSDTAHGVIRHGVMRHTPRAWKRIELRRVTEQARLTGPCVASERVYGEGPDFLALQLVLLEVKPLLRES